MYEDELAAIAAIRKAERERASLTRQKTREHLLHALYVVVILDYVRLNNRPLDPHGAPAHYLLRIFFDMMFLIGTLSLAGIYLTFRKK